MGSHVDRCFQALLMTSIAALSWLLMMVVHECGHVLNGWLSGARIALVDLPVWGISRTDFAVNPHPLFVAWGGGMWGCLLPLVLWTAVCMAMPRYAYLAAWFAGFCLIANGGYLAGGAFFRGGADDAGVILQNGSSRWLLFAFGIPAVAAGLYVWNGLGPSFGLGVSRGKVDRKAAVGSAIALVAVVCIEMLIRNN